VNLPAGKTPNIFFEVTKLERQAAYQGPLRFVDVARSIAKILSDRGEKIMEILRYRLIEDLA
jgi:hypothetical protein